eukprot:6910783-Prymnesium_polylepis.1
MVEDRHGGGLEVRAAVVACGCMPDCSPTSSGPTAASVSAPSPLRWSPPRHRCGGLRPVPRALAVAHWSSRVRSAA